MWTVLPRRKPATMLEIESVTLWVCTVIHLMTLMSMLTEMLKVMLTPPLTVPMKFPFFPYLVILRVVLPVIEYSEHS